jgi:RNase P subunit RPR2
MKYKERPESERIRREPKSLFCPKCSNQVPLTQRIELVASEVTTCYKCGYRKPRD